MQALVRSEAVGLGLVQNHAKAALNDLGLIDKWCYGFAKEDTLF